jgi:predicted DNA-binding WGR domain protein
MRTFEFKDDKSNKFWNIELKDKDYTVTFGKIGTKGQTKTKSFPTSEKAQKEYDKLITEKTDKGYVETTPK